MTVQTPKKDNVYPVYLLILMSAMTVTLSFGYVEGSTVHWVTDADTTQIAGAKGDVKVDPPLIEQEGIDKDFRDYLVYVNMDTTSSTIGAGWYAYKHEGTVETWDLTYYYDGNEQYQVREQYTEITSHPTTYTVYIKQKTDSDSDCWRADTFSSANSHCFPSGSDEGTWAGITTYAKQPQKDDTNGMEGLYDNLYKGVWNNGDVDYLYKFSEDSTLTHCNTSDGYLIDQLDGMDKMGTGPEGYYTNDCGETGSGAPYGY